jgi:hypothetical protein
MKVCLPEKVIFLEGFSGKQSLISSYNKGQTLFIIQKLHTKWQTKSLESASTFRIPPDLLEIDSHEFAELAAMFRDDDCNTVAQAGPLDIVK